MEPNYADLAGAMPKTFDADSSSTTTCLCMPAWHSSCSCKTDPAQAHTRTTTYKSPGKCLSADIHNPGYVRTCVQCALTVGYRRTAMSASTREYSRCAAQTNELFPASTTSPLPQSTRALNVVLHSHHYHTMQSGPGASAADLFVTGTNIARVAHAMPFILPSDSAASPHCLPLHVCTAAAHPTHELPAPSLLSSALYRCPDPSNLHPQLR
jgi:hypothetical protein